MSKTILMADDEPDIFKIVQVRLVKLGYHVLLANNGREAVDKARIHHPDLIIMDYRMPVMNGLEAIRRLKQDEPLRHIPIILMSASSTDINADIIKKSAVDAYVPKPFESAELMRHIERLLK